MPIAESALLVCTVGGSPAPILYGIKAHRPGHVLFVCSKGSAASVEEQILPALEARPAWRLLLLSDEQDLLACVTDIRAGLAGALEAWNLPRETALLGDFTGGTKVMSAALVMALMESDVQFTYTGGGQRSKNGLGAVQDGEERTLFLANPWQALSFVHIQQLADAFSGCQFQDAERLAQTIASHGVRPDFFSALALLSRAYGFWDGFCYAEAAELFDKALPLLENAAPAALMPLFEQMRGNGLALKTAESELRGFLDRQQPCPAYLRDVLANALRRREQGRYDDAVARLYSVLEKAAKIALLCDCGLDSSALAPERIPPQFLEATPLLPGRDGTLYVPLFKAFQLLACLNHPLGLRFMEQQEALDTLLRARNFSLLAHGFEPVTEETCARLQRLVFTFLNIREQDIVRFPALSASVLK